MSNSHADQEGTRALLARPEHALLLCCARTRLDPATAARLRSLLGEKLDWDYLLKLARRHSLLPLLYWQLNATAPGLVPPERLLELKRRFGDNAAHNALMAAEVVRVLRLFERAGIAALAYKGPALAVSAYGNLSLRRFSDLDVLVPERDVLPAKELLIAEGFRAHPELDPAREAILIRAQHSIAFKKERGRLLFELHWRAAASRFASSTGTEDFLEGAETVVLHGAEVKCPAAEDLLPALCVHGAKHFWERLAWVCDIAELIRSHPSLDWARVLRRAKEHGSERMLFLGLRLAAELLGAEPPAEVWRLASADPVAGALAREVAARDFDGCEYAPVGLLGGIRFNLRARPRQREKLGYLRFIFAPTDGDLSHVKLPRRLSFAYYVIRPFRLLLKGHDSH